MVNTSPSQGDIHGFKSHMGHHKEINELKIVHFFCKKVFYIIETILNKKKLYLKYNLVYNIFR